MHDGGTGEPPSSVVILQEGETVDLLTVLAFQREMELEGVAVER